MSLFDKTINKVGLIDKKIICELDEDCRQSRQRIAHKLRVSRAIVEYRIKRLEQIGVIKKYICSVNLGKFGYKTYKIYLKVHHRPEKEFVDFLINSPMVIHALKTEGEFDYSLAVATISIQELDNFLSDLKSQFKNLIKDYYVSLVVYTRIFKAQKLLLGDKKLLPKIDKYSGEEKTGELDDKDKIILRTLAQEANLSLRDISHKTKLSLDVVKYHLKQLNQKAIMSNRVIIDFPKLGYYHYVISLKACRSTSEDEKRIFSWCAVKRNVLYCSKRIGLYEFEINIAIKDINELNQFLEELKTEFSEIIDSHAVMINSRLLKLNYIPF